MNKLLSYDLIPLQHQEIWKIFFELRSKVLCFKSKSSVFNFKIYEMKEKGNSLNVLPHFVVIQCNVHSFNEAHCTKGFLFSLLYNNLV